MNTPRELNPAHLPPVAQDPLTHKPLVNPPSSKDQRDWMLSSLELREGLSVREILETLPAELLDLL